MNNRDHMIPVVLKNMAESLMSPDTNPDMKLMYEAMIESTRDFCNNVLTIYHAEKVNSNGKKTGRRNHADGS